MELRSNPAASEAVKTRLLSGRTLLISRDKALCASQTDDVIAVYDDRRTGDPSFRILRSYRIVSQAQKREILRALIEYDRADPVSPAWKRSERSLLKEWVIHNAAYRVGVFRDHARDVDLDNHEEGKGWLHFVLRGFRALHRRLKRRLIRRNASS